MHCSKIPHPITVACVLTFWRLRHFKDRFFSRREAVETITKTLLLDPLLVMAVSGQPAAAALISSCHLPLHLPTQPSRENSWQAWLQSQEPGSLPGSWYTAGNRVLPYHINSPWLMSAAHERAQEVFMKIDFCWQLWETDMGPWRGK